MILKGPKNEEIKGFFASNRKLIDIKDRLPPPKCTHSLTEYLPDPDSSSPREICVICGKQVFGK